MTNWLENVTDEQIKELIKRVEDAEVFELRRYTDANGIYKIGVLIRYSYGYEKEKTFSAFGEILKFSEIQLNHISREWCAMVNEANIKAGNNGYIESFCSAHYRAIEYMNNEALKLDEEIKNLKARKSESLKNIEDYRRQVNEMSTYLSSIKNSNSSQLGLLAKDFLSKMDKEERIAWLKENRLFEYDANNTITEDDKILINR